MTASNNNYNPVHHQRLDACHLSCPLPLLQAKQALAQMQTGEVLWVLATDPGSWQDFASFAELSAHTLLERQQLGDTYHFLMSKG